MRWYTCTPVRFQGGAAFFSRDSGLLSRGFRTIGLESRAVMPGPARPDDVDELLRTDYQDLESSDWWRRQKLDGVVLYAWGRPRFRKVASAIREAGIFLVLNQDSGGLVSPLNGLGPWLREQTILAGAGRVPGGWIRCAGLIGRGLSLGLAVTDPLRARHLREGNLIACVSPAAADHYRRLCRIYGGRELEGRIRVIPHPVNPLFNHSGRPKQRRVVAVGRWDDRVQKRPSLLMSVVTELVRVDSEVIVEIVGPLSPEFHAWHESLDRPQQARVRLRGRVLPEKIASLLDEAQISYCPSAFESFHIASGEALCSGCSVVAGDSPSMASFAWFCGEGSGRLASSDNQAGHVAALRDELDAWAGGCRDAAKIRTLWQSRLHAPEVAKQVISLSET